MLAGEAVVAIWNGIAEDVRDDFYAWHDLEHMPERAGIPGFLRGRRYIAADSGTAPEFFTLYEATSLPVLTGADYANRLNEPTEATRRVTRKFRDTRRAIARVIASHGPGVGGALLTVGFAGAEATHGALMQLAYDTAAAPRVTGAHLCVTDARASGVKSGESAGRTDISAPPALFFLIEATDIAALAGLLADAALRAVGAGALRRGFYRLEYLRGKTAFDA
ncbi:MAG: hypothetical protein ACREFJ_08645 [Acetobacteraceae bacterium]